MPGTLSFYFFILTLIPIWNGQLASGCYYDLRTAQTICPVNAPVRVERRQDGR